jgi:F-type H+-transporting ATPase subunit a
MSTGTPLASSEIEIGHHVEAHLFGFTVHADTIWTTVIAGAIVIGLGFWVRAKVTSKVPGKVQIVWELLISTVTRQVEQSLGRVNPFVVPLAVSLFAFILIANWLHAIPSGDDPHLLPAPTADVNLTYALGLLVIVGVHVFSIQKKGFKGYVKHYFEPYPALFPINVIEEIVKPFTLALRLFGNIFSGGIMVSLIGLFPLYILWGPNAVWKLFDLFIGVIQAFIFALLTILYFGMAGESHDDEAHPDKESDDAGSDTADATPHDTDRTETESDERRVPTGATAG